MHFASHWRDHVKMLPLSPRGISQRTNRPEAESASAPTTHEKQLRSGGTRRHGVAAQRLATRSSTIRATAAEARPESPRMENTFSNFEGEHGSQSQPFYGSDQWAYRFAAGESNFEEPNIHQYNFVLPSQAVSTPAQPVSDVGGVDPDVEEVPCPIGSRKGKEKKVSRRGANFTPEEDSVICAAWLTVSKDPIVGASQTQGSYYKRMHNFFNENKPEGSNRSQVAIQGRWSAIQKAVNKFCGYKSVVDRRNESGKNEADRIEDTLKLYEKNEPFHYMHCWKILKDQAKWNEKLLEESNYGAAKGKKDAESFSKALHSESQHQSETNVGERPEGRDSAKRRTKREAESSSSAAVEVLQRIHDSREKSQLKEDEQLSQILSRKDEKLNLQREILQLKRQTREEHLQLRKQETELLAKQTEAQLLTAEAGIMGIDLDKVASHLKDYYIGMQRQIMERRGFAPPNNNNSS